GGDVGYRQGFPEQDAAIATLAVQCVDAIKRTHDDPGKHQETRRHVERLLGGPWIKSQRPFPYTRNDANGEAEQGNTGNGQWCDINRTVLPQFASHRPVQWPSRRWDRR